MFYFLSKLIWLHLPSNFSHIRNSKLCNLRSRRRLISHLVKTSPEEAEAQRSEVVSPSPQRCSEAKAGLASRIPGVLPT